MTSIYESFVFAGTEWNDGTIFAFDTQDGPPFDPGIAPKRFRWISGADSDGALPADEAHYDNAEMTVRVTVMPQADMDTALSKIGDLVKALQECEKQPLGSPGVWTPANSTKSLTAYVVAGEVIGLPVTMEAGYFAKSPTITLKLYRRPFLYGPEVTTITDDFSTNTIANYTFDTGGGTLAVSGGQLVPSDTSDKILYRSAENRDYYASQETIKIVTGASVASGSIGLTMKRLSSSSYLTGQLGLGGGASSLALYKYTGSFTGLTSVGTFAVSAATSYWLRMRTEGNLITLELWTSAPTATGTAAQSLTYTLTGSDATTWGLGVGGKLGIRTSGIPTDFRYDDLEIVPNTFKSSSPYISGAIYGVEGDVDAEARLVITDNAAQSRRHVEWGIENRYYNSATSLIIESDDLVTSGFAGAQTTRTGAYDVGGGNTVVRATLTTTPVAVCGLGNLSHVGTFRVKARVYAAPTSDATAGDFNIRLSWREGDGPLRSNDYVSPALVSGWSEVDLGTITIPEKALGTQRWTGQIEAYSEDTGDTLDVDFLLPIPAGEGYGKARAPITFETVTAFAARDEFDQAAGNLNGKSLPVGGTWATSGAATDLAVEATGHTVERSTTSDATPRWALASLAAFAGQVSQVDVKFSTAVPASSGPIARWANSSNYVTAILGGTGDFAVVKVDGGSEVALVPYGVHSFSLTAGTWYSVRLAVFSTGGYAVWVWQRGTSIPSDPTAVGADSALATGGSLATGQVGVFDRNSAVSACTRNYDNFIAAAATGDAAVFSGRSAEIRHDSAQRQDSTGTYYGPAASYRGARFYLPPLGSAARPSRVFAKGRRNDIDVAPDDQVADSTTVAVPFRPRYYVAPR